MKGKANSVEKNFELALKHILILMAASIAIIIVSGYIFSEPEKLLPLLSEIILYLIAAFSLLLITKLAYFAFAKNEKKLAITSFIGFLIYYALYLKETAVAITQFAKDIWLLDHMKSIVPLSFIGIALFYAIILQLLREEREKVLKEVIQGQQK